MKRVLFGLLIVLVSSSSAAQPTDSEIVTRRVLIEEAQEARKDGRHAEALDYAERAGKIRMTASVRRFIAEEQSTLGNFADALRSAETCVQEASTEQGTNAQAVLQGCVEIRTGLRLKVGEVILHVAQPDLAGLIVSVAGQVVDRAKWAAPYVVTPGAVVIEAAAPEYEGFHAEVSVAAGSRAEVAVTLTPRPSPPPSPAARIEMQRTWSPLGFVVAGGGAVFLVGGLATGIASTITYDDLKTKCTLPASCDANAASFQRQTVQSLDTFTNFALISGAVLVVTGVILVFTVRPLRPKIALGPNAGVMSFSF